MSHISQPNKKETNKDTFVATAQRHERRLPDELARSVAAYVGCIAGAISVAEYEGMYRDAWFAAAKVIDAGKDLNSHANVENGAGGCGADARHHNCMLT